VLKRWAGPLVTVLILGGVVLIVVLNLDLKGTEKPPKTDGSLASEAGEADAAPAAPGSAKPAGFREYPIGDPVEKNHMRINAVWLPSIQMEGMSGSAGAEMIHLEADVHSLAGNPNGFALDEFIPYMKIRYKVFSAKQGDKPLLQGDLMPMVAGDGLHYGVSLAMPESGEYRLVFALEPPSAGGLGRHTDPATGVGPWWEPFEASFDWDYEALPRATATPKTEAASVSR